MSTDERLAGLESSVAAINTTLEFHGVAHKEIAADVKQILLLNAEKTGEGKAAKKIAATISALVSVLISLVIAYFSN